MKYDAFISYSHTKTDAELASNIEKALEEFGKPVFKRRALSIFRDQNNLSASPDLWGKIEESLSQSDYFIFLASPNSSESKWCRKEIDYWLKNKSTDNFLIAITDGVLLWDEEKSDFDWTKTNAIPDNLSGFFKNEPLYVDFRENRGGAEQNITHTDFRMKTVSLAATIHGKSVEDMDSEGIRQYKKTIRIRNAAIAILSALLVVALLLAYYAIRQKKSAVQNANRALANSYRTEAKANKDFDPTISMKIAEYGYRFSQRNKLGSVALNFEDQLIEVYNKHSFYYLDQDRIEFQNDQDPSLASLHAWQGKKLIFNDTDFLVLEDQDGQKIELEYPEEFGWGNKFSYTLVPGSNCIFVRYNASYTYNVRDFLSVYAYNGKHIAQVEALYPEILLSPKMSADGKQVIIASQHEVELIRNIHEPNPKSIQLDKSSGVKSICISIDGKHAALGRADGSIKIFDLSKPYTIQSWDLHGHQIESVDQLKFSDDNRYLFSQSHNLTRKWKLDWISSYIEFPQKINAQNYYISNPDTVTKNPEWKMNIHHGSYIYFNKLYLFNNKGDTIKFEPLKTFMKGDTISGGRYYANPNGLYDQIGNRLISYVSGEMDAKSIQFIKFSNDGNYLLAHDKVYCLNPEIILADFHRRFVDEEVEFLNREEKERYLILDDTILQ